MNNIIRRDNMIIFTSVPFSPSLKTISYENKRWFSCPDVMRILRRTAMNTWEKTTLAEHIKSIEYIKSSGKPGTQKFIDTYGLNKLLERANNNYVNKWFTDSVFPELKSAPTKTIHLTERPSDPFAEKWDEIMTNHPLHKFVSYHNPKLGNLRACRWDGKSWFCSDDICYILHIRFPKNALSKVPRKEKKIINFGRISSSTLMLSETGVNTVAEFATHTYAKALLDWMNADVIPAINKESDESFIIPVYRNKEEALKKRLEEARAKANIADMLSSSDTCFYIGDLAKMLTQTGFDIGQQKLFALLRDEGYLCKDKAHWNYPTQRSMNQGLFHISAKPYISWKGSTSIHRSVRVTGKGVVYFLDKYISSREAA